MSDYEEKGLFFWEKLDKDNLSNDDLEKIVCSANGQAVKEKAAELLLSRLSEIDEDAEDYDYIDDERLHYWGTILRNVVKFKPQIVELILNYDFSWDDGEVYLDYFKTLLEYGDSESQLKLGKQALKEDWIFCSLWFYIVKFVPVLTSKVFLLIRENYEKDGWYSYVGWNVFIEMDNRDLASKAVDMYLNDVEEYSITEIEILGKIVKRFPEKRQECCDILMGKVEGKEIEQNKENSQKIAEIVVVYFPELESDLEGLEQDVVKDHDYYLDQLLSCE